MPVPDTGPQPVNDPETTLKTLFERASFQSPTAQHTIELGLPLGRTVVDFFFGLPDGAAFDGICVYLDGLSRNIHGNPAQQQKDREKREQLRNLGYEVVGIAASELTDRDAMIGYMRRIARILTGKQKAEALQADTSWYLVETIPPPKPASDGWDEVLGLVDAPWRPLLEGLRAAGVEAPADADWDLSAAGRVSGARAIVVWRPDVAWVALVDRALGLDDRGHLVSASTSDVAIEIARVVAERLAAGAP
jgi:hypothetical protein